MLSDYEMGELLSRARTVAVVGLSDRPARDSYAGASFLQRNGYQIIPVNPHLSAPVLGQTSYASLRDVPVHIDIVDVFRRSEFLPEIVEDAIAIGAGMVWAQLGVVNQEAARIAKRAGLTLVMDRCIAIEHRRMMRYAQMETAR